MGHTPTSLRLFCLGACLWLLQAAALTETRAQGTIQFRNYFWRYDGTNRWLEEQPIFLADGSTRAQGSNIVVELWARNPFNSELEFISQTNLLDGARAGLFDGGVLRLNPIGLGNNAILEVRAWDRTTGTNYQSASLKGATAFENETGGWGSPPTLPEELVGFHSFCLGNPNCLPRQVVVDFRYDFYYEGGLGGALHSNEFVVASTAASKTIRLYRFGELIAPTTVIYTTIDETATNDIDYVQQTGTITFAPLETIQTFEVPILNNPFTSRVASVRLQVQNEDPSTGSARTGRLWILGDRASLITNYFFKRPGISDAVIYWVYCKTNCVLSVEFADDLNQPVWRTLIQHARSASPEPVAVWGDVLVERNPRRFYRVRVE